MLEGDAGALLQQFRRAIIGSSTGLVRSKSLPPLSRLRSDFYHFLNELSPFTWSSIFFISFCIVSAFKRAYGLLACGGGGGGGEWNLLKFIVPCGLSVLKFERIPRARVVRPSCFLFFYFFLFVTVCIGRNFSFDEEKLFYSWKNHIYIYILYVIIISRRYILNEIIEFLS